MRRSLRTALTIAIVLVVGWKASSARAAMQVPVAMQAAIFKKVFRYDKVLQEEDGKLTILIATPSSGTTDAATLKRAFDGLEFEVSVVDLAAAGGRLSSVQVLYVLSDSVPPSILDLAVKHKVLTVSGNPALAEAGKVSVAIGAKDKKPEIIVHLARLKAEGHSLSSSVLGLARVIK